MLILTLNQVINLIKESGVKEYEYVKYYNGSWQIKFKQLGDKDNHIILYGKNILEDINIAPNQLNKNYDKHVLESIIKGDDDYDDIKHIKIVYVTDDSEEDIKDE